MELARDDDSKNRHPALESRMAGVTIKGLSKRYGAETAAVSDLDLVIRDNSFVTLLGPSGCGKTTTLRLIAGYMRPDAGTIHVGDRLLSSPGGVVPPEHRGMGMVFQNYAVWPHKTVYENVVFGLKLRRVPPDKARQQVAAALAIVNVIIIAAAIWVARKLGGDKPLGESAS